MGLAGFNRRRREKAKAKAEAEAKAAEQIKDHPLMQSTVKALRAFALANDVALGKDVQAKVNIVKVLVAAGYIELPSGDSPPGDDTGGDDSPDPPRTSQDSEPGDTTKGDESPGGA